MNQASAQMFKHMPVKSRCDGFSSKWTPGYGSNIAGYWQMNGTVGPIANGASIPATIGAGGATMSGTTSNYVATVLQSQAISMTGVNGDNNYITVGTPAALNDLTAMTLMMWIKVPASTTMGLAYKSDNNSSRGWFLYIDNDYQFHFDVVAASSNLKYNTGNTTASIAGTWAQVVVTWEGGLLASSVHVYVNGVEWTTAGSGYSQNGSGLHDSDAAEPLYLGYRGSGGSSANFKGELDETAIWNRALSAAEVAYLYKNQTCN